MKRLLRYARLVRPEQWIKNNFVLAPLIFSRELFDPGPLLTALRACFGFCFVAGAVYILNDLADLAEDRSHPVKKHRPLASGEVSRSEAFTIGFLLLAAGTAVTLGLSPKFHLLLSGYLLINILYSIKLKEIILLDVFLVASGFMLRVLAGAYAIDVPVSSWIVLCTMFISLFLGFAKRRGELLLGSGSRSGSERKVLLVYRVEFIDQMLTIAAAGAVITYALYTVAPSTQEVFRTDKVIYTTVFVLYGVFRYLYLVHTTRSTDNPTAAVTTDGTIVATGLLWIVTCVFMIYSD
jgi:4-hydroxybenzoate polyprenyltransferase